MAKADSSSNPWPHMAAPTNPAHDVAPQSEESPLVPDPRTFVQGASAKQVDHHA